MTEKMSANMKEHDAQYSMRLVTRLTGLSPDTIRAWERRYNAVTPIRSDGNTRRFSSQDVRRLSLLKEATDRGHRIGDIALLSEEKLHALIDIESSMAQPRPLEAEENDVGKGAFERIRRDYFEAVQQFEVRRARDLLARASTVLNPRDFVLDVVLPIMRETGRLWEQQELTVAQEHLISMQVRGLLDTILRLSAPHPGVPRIIVATPQGQIHEFGALAGALWAGMRGFDVLYVGADVPADDLIDAVDRSNSQVLLLSVVLRGTPDEMRELARTIDDHAGRVETWVGLDPSHPVAELVERARLFHRFADLDMALTELVR